jgi:hypothetical protein
MTDTELALTSEPEKDPNVDDGGKNRSNAVGRIAVALVIAWTALVAIPGAVPWTATDDTARALALGIGIASIIALVGLALAWLRTDQLGVEGATFGTAGSLAALGLAGLEVINLMLLPDDATYRRAATGIGLLVVIVITLATVAAIRTNFFAGFRLSNISLVGSVIALVIVAVYLVMIQSMFAAAGPDTQDAEWTRLNALLATVQTLAFTAVGALLGTAVQSQVTSSVREELGKADTARESLEQDVQENSAIVHEQATMAAGVMDGIVLDALQQDPGRFQTETARRRWLRSNLPDTTERLTGVAESMEKAVARSRRIRTGHD